LSQTDRGLGSFAVSIAAAVIVDDTKLAGERRLDEYSGAFVTHDAMHKHDRLSGPSVQDVECHAIDFGRVHLWPGHIATSSVLRVHCLRRLKAG
jgi:hypothetical protein